MLYAFTFLNPEVLLRFPLFYLLYFSVDVDHKILPVNQFASFKCNLGTFFKSKFHMDIMTEGFNCLYLFLSYSSDLAINFKSSM